jgi:hypothetical protein
VAAQAQNRHRQQQRENPLVGGSAGIQGGTAVGGDAVSNAPGGRAEGGSAAGGHVEVSSTHYGGEVPFIGGHGMGGSASGDYAVGGSGIGGSVRLR